MSSSEALTARQVSRKSCRGSSGRPCSSSKPAVPTAAVLRGRTEEHDLAVEEPTEDRLVLVRDGLLQCCEQDARGRRRHHRGLETDTGLSFHSSWTVRVPSGSFSAMVIPSEHFGPVVRVVLTT